MRYVVLFMFASSALHGGWAWAQSVTKPAAAPSAAASSPELDAIRRESQAFVDAFNQADAAALAKQWTQDGEFIDGTGLKHIGQQEIQQGYADFFADNPGAKLQIQIESLKLLSSAAAMEEGTTLVQIPPASAALGHYTAVHVKVDGAWKMASVRDTLVDTNAAQESLADLEFLIGKWSAEEHGVKHESVCHWIINKQFVQRDFTTTQLNGSQQSGMQLIGWNPLSRSLQTWIFSPDGGHSVGVLVPTPEGWAADMQGVTGDGVLTSSTNLLRRLDENAYVWQSLNRVLGGVTIADTDEVVLKRQPAAK